jgi:RecA-family ATPase
VGELAGKIEDAIRRRGIDVVILDPLMKAHAGAENSNEQIDLVTGILTRIAAECDCAIDALHHVAKGAADPGNADKGRGASACSFDQGGVGSVHPGEGHRAIGRGPGCARRPGG